MPVWLHLKPEWVGKVRERKKVNIAVLFRSNPTRNRKFQKNSKKILKNIKKKFHYCIISSQNSLETAKKERK